MTGNTKKIRALLKSVIADLTNCNDEYVIVPVLKEALALTYRTRSGRPRAKPRARKVTPLIAASVQMFAASYPAWSLQQIADHYRLGSGGRVSEILTGQWQKSRAEYEEIKEHLS